MVIRKAVNNGNYGFTIFDSIGEYFIHAEDESEAIIKYKEMKTSETLLKQEDYKQQRAKEYPPTDDLIVALWEMIVENNSESVDRLQQLRIAIKGKYPKPIL